MPSCLAGLHFAANVNLRRGIVSREDDGKPGPQAGCGHLLDLFADLGLDFAAILLPSRMMPDIVPPGMD